MPLEVYVIPQFTQSPEMVMKMLRIDASRAWLAVLFVGTLAAYLPYPGLPNLPSTVRLWLMHTEPEHRSPSSAPKHELFR
ncbi:MAG: hypothetical protein HC910_12870 [Spirulinaceae cyanobacterium SM2_1_0]|nr:hypothetical protein [Spirulinaceae cyanobacterium SM2_1_0]